MSLFKKFFSKPKTKPDSKEEEVDKKNLPLDQVFVENFINNHGKFLYCTSLSEVVASLANIIEENNWKKLFCEDTDLLKVIKTLPVEKTATFGNEHPFFISCEFLIAENGSILFSSNQLKEYKLADLSENFIVYATTSQIVSSKSESLTGIKMRYNGNIPSNISAVKHFDNSMLNEDFMHYGNTNSKNLYLILYEDL